MSKDPRITSNSDGHWEPAVERRSEHKGKEGPDFIGEWQKQMGIRDRDDAVRFYSETLNYGQRMYELGKAARPQDAPDVAAKLLDLERLVADLTMALGQAQSKLTQAEARIAALEKAGKALVADFNAWNGAVTAIIGRQPNEGNWKNLEAFTKLLNGGSDAKR